MQAQKHLRVLITPDKFRGSLNATQICDNVEQAFLEFETDHNVTNNVNFAIQTLQLADGGQGSLQTLEKHIPSLKKVQIQAKDPLFRPVHSYYLVDSSNSIAYIEMAKASGLALLDVKDRNPLNTTTFGVGQMIFDAIQKNIKRIFLFIGGSATNDAGIGMAAALGFKFLDSSEKQLSPIGSNLLFVYQIMNPCEQMMNKIESTDISVVSDVQNVFFGHNGAAYVYGPQKGADLKAVQQLDKGLRNINQFFKLKYNKDLEKQKGSGAAGGLGGGAIVFLKAKIKRGIEKVMQILNYHQKIQACDLVITGQGKLDHQSLAGKVVFGVINKAKKYGKTVWILCGVNQLNQETDLKPIYDKINVIPLVDEKVTQQQAIKNCKALIKLKVKNEINKYLSLVTK